MPNKIARTCAKCGETRLIHEHTTRRTPSVHCQPCSVAVYNASRVRQPKAEKRARQRRWFEDNRQHLAGYYADYRDRIRLEMVQAYGGACCECGEDDPIVLVLDHINDDGQVDKKLGLGGFKAYMALRKQGWPKTRHQLMCHNCNFRKEYRRRKDAVKKRSSSSSVRGSSSQPSLCEEGRC